VGVAAHAFAMYKHRIAFSSANGSVHFCTLAGERERGRDSVCMREGQREREYMCVFVCNLCVRLVLLRDRGGVCACVFVCDFVCDEYFDYYS